MKNKDMFSTKLNHLLTTVTKISNTNNYYGIILIINTYIVLFANKLPVRYYYNLVTNIVICGYIYQFYGNHKIII